MRGLAGLQRVDELKVRITYHGWCIQESDEALVPVPFPDEAAEGGFLTPFAGRLDFYSAGHTHTAAVSVEHWDAEPVPDARTVWEERGEAELVSGSGAVAVWSDGRDHELSLLAPGTWKVRAYCAGRAEVARVCEEDGVADGVETYLLQLWPAAA
ncbi:hypothetical protein [Streptomyces ochraceiscleroticus]|uniref:Uncharacterized protein n=1 Tax=Streptomyces ochraceiscleroticus TaxID=47761 RepID=A0ABW1MM50_9ACTN